MSVNIYDSTTQKLNNVASGGSRIGHLILDKNGNELDQEPALQFTGNVVISTDLENERTVINITDSGHTIVDGEGLPAIQRSILQFVGDGVSVTDDDENNRTVISIEGGGTTIVQKPTVTVETYTYNGNAQGPTITGLDTANTVVTNATKVNAGTYTLTIALKNSSKMVWDDLSNADLIYNYTINKKASTVTISPTSVEINMDSSIATATYSTTGDGIVTVTNNNSNIYNMSYNSNTITITDKDQTSGEGTVTIAISEGTNYFAASATLNVKASYKPDIVTFADGTDAQISAMLEAYYNDVITWNEMGWAVGDTRKIHLNSFAAPNPNSSTTLSAQDITVVIVAHDHTDLETPINGHSKSCITVQFREALGSTSYNGKDGTIYVNGDSSYDTTFTKWSNLYMRTYINNVLLGAFPSGDFKSAIKPSTHYRHTTYNGNTSELVTDTLFLPSFPEIFGTASYSYYVATSPVEGTQFSYYTTTSNRIKYNNNNGSKGNDALYWWNGSASSNYDSSNGYRWCRVTTDGSAYYGNGISANGLAPAFAM